MNQNISHHFYILLLLAGVVSACTPAVHESRHTLDVADSLRVNEGRLYDDSLALAEAYTLLGHWRLIYPDDYARACYYYGRMLRHRGNQVAAMRAFISGTHAPYMQRVVPLPWFSDYHILGRIYSNMGTMSHLAGEFELSYEMYKTASEQILKTDDSTSYYYLLNDMAVELAEQKLQNETLSLLKKIDAECTNADVLTKTWETKAILYKNLAQYDSAIYAARQLYSNGYSAATGYVIDAQSYWHLEMYDSALYYAKLVMAHPYAVDQDKYHVLYILMKHDSSTVKEDVQALSSARADLDAEVIEPLLQQLSAAVEVLRQDLDKKPHYIYLCFVLASIALIVGVAWIAKTHVKRITKIEQKKHQHLTKKNIDIRADIEQLQTSNKALLQENNDLLTKHSAYCEEIVREIENNCMAIRQSKDWKQELHWKDYNAFCETVDHYFMLLATKLKATNKLEEKEIRLCILVMLEMDNITIAKTINYAPNGVGKYKYRIAQKLGTKIKDMRQFLIEMAIGR